MIHSRQKTHKISKTSNPKWCNSLFFKQKNQTPIRAIKSRKTSPKPQNELAMLNWDMQKAQHAERIEILHGKIAQNEEVAPRQTS